MDPIRKEAWPLGVNNVANASRLPDGAVRDLVNFDPGADGILSKRAGYELVMTCSNARAAFAVGEYVVVIDGNVARSFHAHTGDIAVLGAVPEDAVIAGAELNGQLYLSAATGSWRTDGTTWKPWAVNPPGFNVEVVSGGTLGGRYLVAAVAVGADKEESGADPVLVVLPQGSSLRLTSDDTRALRMYASVENGSALFYQGLLFGGASAIGSIDDDTEYLTTVGLRSMPHCEELVSYNGVLVGRQGNAVYFSTPMQPHLFDPVSAFFQYPEPVRLLAAAEGGVYIVADKTYFVTNVETDKPQQRVVLNVDAVEGTAVTLPDGNVAWFTRFGQAIADAQGQVQLVNRTTFAPATARNGAAGYLAHNGNEMLVTTMRGTTGVNNMATGDFADLEIG